MWSHQGGWKGQGWGQAAPPWGTQVATRSFVPPSGGYNSGSTAVSSTSVHTATDAITALRIVDVNWYVSQSTGVETAIPAASTREWVIEYPASTFTRITWGGANTVVIPSGGVVESDTLTIAIPVGATIKLNCRQTCTGGILYWDRANAAYGDRLSFGAEAPTAAIPNNLAGYAYAPAAIIAQTTKRSAIFFGTSRTYGINDTSDTTGDIGIIGRGAGKQIAYCNAGIPSDKASWFLASSTNRQYLSRYFTDVVVEHGKNDPSGTRVADVQSVYNLFPSKRVHGVSISPGTSGAWTSADGSDQTVVDAVDSFNNTLPRALPAPLYSNFECADPVIISRASNKWKAPGYTTDGIHESQTAAIAVRDAGAVDFGLPYLAGNLLSLNQSRLVGWTNANRGTTTPLSVNTPEGALLGATFIEDTSSNTHYPELFFGQTIAAIPYEWSVLAKPIGSRALRLQVFDGSFGSNAAANFTLSGAGAILTAASVGGSFTTPSARIANVGGGWYRCVLRFTGAAGLSNFDMITQPITLAGGGTYQGDGVSGLYLAQADLRKP